MRPSLLRPIASRPAITTSVIKTRESLYISPLCAPDHSGLPPALVQVAEHDPIRDDGLRYAATLRAAGVAVRTTTYVGMPHGYLSFPKLCRSAPQALAELCAELSSALKPGGVPHIEVTTPA